MRLFPILLLLLAAIPAVADGDARERFRALFLQGDYAAAESVLADAAPANGAAHAETLFDLGVCALRTARFARAESMFRESVLTFDRLGAGMTSSAAIAREGLATVLIEQGNVLEAESVLERSYLDRRAYWGEDHPQTLRTLNLLAALMRNEERDDEAVALYRRVLRGFRRLYGNVHPMTAAAVQNLGISLLETQDPFTVEIMFRQGLYILTQIHGETHPALAEPLCGLGQVFDLTNQPDRAADAFGEALDLLDSTEDGSPRTTILAVTALTGLARLDLEAGEADDAVDRLEDAVARFDRMRSRTGADTEPATFMASPRPLLAHALLTLGRGDEAWDVLEEGRGFLDRDSAYPATARIRSLGRELFRLESALAEIDATLDSDLVARRNACLAERARLMDQDRTAARLGRRSGGEPGDGLPPGTAVIGWLETTLARGAPARWVFCIKPGTAPVWHRLADIGAGESRGLIAAFRDGARSRELFDDRGSAAAAALWQDRFAPVDAHLEGVSTLGIVAVGDMATVPFAALGPAGGPVLIDRFRLMVGSAARAFRTPNAPDAPQTARPLRVLVIADPAYSSDPDVPHTQLSGPVLRSILGRNREALSSLPRLPGTLAEARAIERRFPGARILLGAAANESALRETADTGALERYDIIHLGAHALIDVVAPDRSAVALTPIGAAAPSASTVADDGLISAREIRLGWSLNADVVVLSGCETGLGLSTADEGVLGLTDALLSAGARTVVSSLWKVDDAATSRLMEFFYEELQRRGLDGDGPHEALRVAQRRLRDTTSASGGRPFAGAWAWGGFVISGR